MAELRASWGETLRALLLVSILEVLTFWAYFSGARSPQWDFLASYLTDAYAWWNRGGMLSPPSWMSYAWMGYPAAASIQNSSYYLPVGLMNAVVPYTVWPAALLAALHVGFGAIGAYVLAQRIFRSEPAALLALVAWFYSPGFYANAQHVDITRGIGWIPWVLLVASPLWWWRRWWSLPLAALVLWQFVVSAYPGQVVAAAYVVPVWAICWAIALRRPTWLLGPAVAGLAAILLAMPKFGSALALGVGTPSALPESVKLSLSTFATVFFSYGDPALPNDISMRPFFVVAPVLMMLGFARFRSRRVTPILAAGLVPAIAIVLVAAFPEATRSLPGLGLSRFRIADFRPFFLMAVMLLGAGGLARVVTQRVVPRARLAWLAVPLAAAGALWFAIPHAVGRELTSDSLLLSIVVLSSAAGLMAASGRLGARLPASAIVALAVASGLVFAYSVLATWWAEREPTERAVYGVPSAQLVQDARCDVPMRGRRPPRIVPPGSPRDFPVSVKALTGAFSCADYVGGYTNVRGNPAMAAEAQAIAASKDGELLQFFSAPGAVVPVMDNGALDLRSRCLLGGQCAGLTFSPVQYDRNGHWAYRVVASRDVKAVLNESFYRGLSMYVCSSASQCQPLEVSGNAWGAVQTAIPKGSWELRMDYVQPDRAKWMALGFAGLIVAVGAGPTGLAFLAIHGCRSTTRRVR